MAMELTLAEALRRAEGENLSLLATRENITSAEQAAKRARANILPTVNFEVSQTRSQNPIVGGFASEIPGVPRRTFDDRFDARLRANVPLLNAQDFANWQVEKLNAEVAELDFESALQTILATTAQAYFQHQRNLARMEVIRANIDRDTVLLELAQNQFEAGVATPIDVTRAETRLAQNERERLAQETILLQSELLIKRLIRMDFDAAMTLVMVSVDEPGGITHSLTEVLERRPEFQVATRLQERNQVARRAAGFERLPTMNVFADWGYLSETIFDGEEEEQWLVGISLSVPLFEGFRIRANKMQADALIRQQGYLIDDLSDTISADLRVARHEVNSRFQQIALARKEVELSNRELELARTRFEEGVADNSDVVEAQANLAAAAESLVEAEYLFHLARVNLAQVRGDVRDIAR